MIFEDKVTEARIKAAADALYHFHILPTMDATYTHIVGPWFVVDGHTAEPDVNYPGELISEHASQEEARLGLAKAVLEFADRAAEIVR